MTNLQATHPELNLFVASTPSLNGVLKIQGFGDQYDIIKDKYLDHLGTFKNWTKVGEFSDDLEKMGMSTYFDVPGNILYHNLQQFASTDFICNAPFLESNELYRFQHTHMNNVYHLLRTEKDPRVLVKWSPGAGKTVMANLIAQKLFDEGRIDAVLCFCKRNKQLDWLAAFDDNTTLTVEGIDGVRSRRHERLASTNSQVLVMNYEKARFPSKKGRGKNITYDWSKTDLEQLMTFITNKRILIIADEAQKINNSASQLSQGFNSLFNGKVPDHRPYWVGGLALTATPYSTSPLNIRDLYTILVPGLSDVAIPKARFEDMYMDHKWGRDLFGEVRKWDQEKLYVLGKKHEHFSSTVSKSDPDIACQFPPQLEKDIPLELSEADKKLYNALQKEIHRFTDWNYMLMKSTVGLVRAICNTPEAILHSQSSFCQEMKPYVTSTAQSTKFQYIADSVKDILSNDEKVVLFTFWTHNTLFPYQEALLKELGHTVPFWSVYGEGMSSAEMQGNIQKFNEAKGGAVLLSSDVGKDGVNLYAQNVIHIETPSVYSDYRQRSDRVNRTDSFDHGISTNLIQRFITADTIEEAIEHIMLGRKDDAGIISAESESVETLTKLLFPDRGRNLGKTLVSRH